MKHELSCPVVDCADHSPCLSTVGGFRVESVVSHANAHYHEPHAADRLVEGFSISKLVFRV